MVISDRPARSLETDSESTRRARSAAMCLDMRFAMAETPKLSVEKALEKLRAADAKKSKNAGRTEKTEALEDEMKRLRAQRLRLDRHQRRTTERD
jgi:hypothetical protein